MKENTKFSGRGGGITGVGMAKAEGLEQSGSC